MLARAVSNLPIERDAVRPRIARWEVIRPRLPQAPRIPRVRAARRVHVPHGTVYRVLAVPPLPGLRRWR